MGHCRKWHFLIDRTRVPICLQLQYSWTFYRFRDKARYWSKISFSYRLHNSPLGKIERCFFSQPSQVCPLTLIRLTNSCCCWTEYTLKALFATMRYINWHLQLHNVHYSLWSKIVWSYGILFNFDNSIFILAFKTTGFNISLDLDVLASAQAFGLV